MTKMFSISHFWRKQRGGQALQVGAGVGRCYLLMGGLIVVVVKGRHQNSLPLTTNFSQKLTQPSKGINYPVGDLCKLTLPSAYTLLRNLIPPTGGTNGL